MFCISKDKKQMRLSKNFTLTEFEKSQTAIRQGLDNTMPEEHLENAKALCENVLQKVRDTPGIPDSGWVHVTYNTAGNRKKSLTASRVDGRTHYSLGLTK